MKYDDFDLQIEPAGDKFRARLLNAPSGQATREFELPFTEIEVANFLSRIGQVRRTMRRVSAPELQAAKEFGGKLFKTVFSEEMHSHLLRSMGQASDKNNGLRIRLRLTGVPGLADLPWEFLYDKDQNHFLTTSSKTPIVRFLDLPQPIEPLRVALPLRVLVMIASPSNLKHLDADGEWQRLQESLGDLVVAGQLVLERLPLATFDALRLRARGAPFHIFHFIGHGSFDEKGQDGFLEFENERGMSYLVRGEQLGTLLYDHRSLRLAVLNACEGARSSREDPFSGVAQSLLQQSVPAVIAMQFEISDAAAKVFALEFYRAVADGYPVDTAVCESRKALFKEEFGQEWATPVLYMRSQEGQLFELQAVAHPPPDEGLKKRQAEEAERLAAAKAEAERVAAEKEEAKRQAARRAEAERAAKAENERQEFERMERERQAREQADSERKATAKAEADRQAAQRAEAKRAVKSEKERLAREQAEQERLLTHVKAEAARQAAAKADAERQAAQRAEADRTAQEQAANEKLKREKAESNRQAREKTVGGILLSVPPSAAPLPRRDRRVWLALAATPVLGLAAWLVYDYEASPNQEPHSPNAEILPAQKELDSAPAAKPNRNEPPNQTKTGGAGGSMGGVLGGVVNSLGTAQPPPKPKRTGRIRVGGNVQSLKIINRVQPVYPALARQTRLSGTVRLHAIIDKDGTIQQLELISGHPLLVQAALDAVHQWRYQPTLLNGEPVEVDTTVDVIFSLIQ